jgi:hypothetical protein
MRQWMMAAAWAAMGFLLISLDRRRRLRLSGVRQQIS